MMSVKAPEFMPVAPLGEGGVQSQFTVNLAAEMPANNAGQSNQSPHSPMEEELKSSGSPIMMNDQETALSPMLVDCTQ
jgi:hypothetical protein